MKERTKRKKEKLLNYNARGDNTLIHANHLWTDPIPKKKKEIRLEPPGSILEKEGKNNKINVRFEIQFTCKSILNNYCTIRLFELGHTYTRTHKHIYIKKI